MRTLSRSIQWRKNQAAGYHELSSRLLSETLDALGACPICDGVEIRPFVAIYGFTYVECHTCGHLFSTTQPTEEMVRRMYQELGTVRSAQRTLYVDNDLFARRVAQIAEPKVDHVCTVVPPRGTWLDVGCGTGEILSAARNAGWRVQGIEADPGEVEFARHKGFDVVQEFVRPENAGRCVHNAQVVSALNIVEHTKRPVEFVGAISSGLRAGAHVVIEVPRHPSLSSFAAMLFPHIACRHLYAPEHLHVFTEQSMAIVLQKGALQPVSVWTFGQDFQELVSSAGLAAGIEESGYFQRVCDLTSTIQQAIDDVDFSDVLFVVARKT